MKICHVIDFWPGTHRIWGGAEQAARRLVEELQHRGIGNLLVTTPTDGGGLSRDFEHRTLRPVENLIDYHRPRSPRSRFFSYLQFFKNLFQCDPAVFFQSRRLFTRHRPNLVHFHNFRRLSFALLLRSFLAGVPRVLTIYDYWFFCPRETLVRESGSRCPTYQGPECPGCLKVTPKYRLPLLMRRPVFKFFLRHFQKIIFLSEASLKLGLDYGLEKERTCVIPQIYNFQAPAAPTGRPETEAYLVYVGWIQERKGLHVLIQALAAARPDLPEDLKLLVVGETEQVAPSYVKLIRALVNRLNLADRVLLLGRRPADETAGLISRSRAVVIPEQWENMSPVVLVEAMHYGRPILASRIGGIPEFIEDGRNGLLFEPGDHHELARKLVEIIRNPDRADNLGKNAAADAASIWNTEHNLKRLLDLYRSLIHA